MQHKAIGANPCDGVDFSASRATGDNGGFEYRPLTAEEVGRPSAAIDGTPPADYDGPAFRACPGYALMVEFMAYTGLRAAEVAGLDVGDLTFAPGPKCTVKVTRTKERKRGEWVVTDTCGPVSGVSARAGTRIASWPRVRGVYVTGGVSGPIAHSVPRPLP